MSATATEPGVDARQLLGVTIGVTSDRRSDDLIATFTRRGAQVLHAPTMRLVPLAEDEQLLAGTHDVIADPPDIVLVTTGIGLRGWVEAADSAGVAPQLLAALGRARILARGPKARGAIRAAGLSEEWSAASEQTVEAVQHLLAQGVAGRSVVVQLHGAADPEEVLGPLAAAGARVRGVAVHRWLPPEDPAAVARLVDAVAGRRLDAVTFTSAPGASELLRVAAELGRGEELVAALRERVVACAVGDVTAEPLRRAGVEPLVPDRWRLGALSRTLSAHLAAHPLHRLPTSAGTLVVRAQHALLDGELLELSPGPFTVLRRLAEAAGGVVTRGDLLPLLPGAGDPHAVEVVVGRLRAALPSPALVRTVVKRGYRLDVVDAP
ncbi:uroporphyrinogen-III synthase [Kineococcus xinjiangensis]|uniref:Uroporphyrinogen-III synthase n=1 Tax=Kineococcus xinjiangensis TaxID=512762 RepID=A0A2S6IW70_9ACTN|nr:uroporphyrinogen-III synthase [Kineococcus xinjiangensis]PPK98609.1 uroporphyrinogen-III synthase [Kineococcus xinjiangensis]